MAKGKRIHATVKDVVVKDIMAGSLSVEEVAKRRNVTINTVKKWVREHKAGNLIKTGAIAVDWGNNVRDAIAFLELAEKACVHQLAGKKRARLTQPELYAMLALRTLKGG